MSSVASEILVSFCNVAPGAPILATVSPDTGRVQVLDLPDRFTRMGGISGLATAGRYIFAVTPRSRPIARASAEHPGPSLLLVLDREDLSLVTEYTCTSVYDAHSLWAAEDELYVVSTATDAVVRLELRGAEVRAEDVHWRPEPAGPRHDLHHLNAIHAWEGSLVVSGFGPKTGAGWGSAAEGFVVDIRTGERVVSGIVHPHSVADIGGRLAYCESASRSIRILGSALSQRLPGYSRGLCRVGEHVFVATSRGRRLSRSTGRLTMASEAGGSLEGRCALFRVSPDSLVVEQELGLEPYGWEVYDLLPVVTTQRWPVVPEIEWRDRAVQGLRASFAERDATISWLHGEVAERDRTVSWLHGEVATRDQTVADLHRDVADRDRMISRLREQADRAGDGDRG